MKKTWLPRVDFLNDCVQFSYSIQILKVTRIHLVEVAALFNKLAIYLLQKIYWKEILLLDKLNNFCLK